jgi:ankyrin repeat protein
MGHVEVARCLVEHGAIVTAQDNIGVTPLHLAIFGEHVDVAKLLIQHGAVSAFQNGETSIQFHQALRNRYVEAAWDLVVQSASAVAQTWVGGLRGIWRRTTDVWNARRPL